MVHKILFSKLNKNTPPKKIIFIHLRLHTNNPASLCYVDTSLCQRLGLTWSVRNKLRVPSIARRRRESPPEAKDEQSESFAGGARGFAK